MFAFHASWVIGSGSSGPLRSAAVSFVTYTSASIPVNAVSIVSAGTGARTTASGTRCRHFPSASSGHSIVSSYPPPAICRTFPLTGSSTASPSLSYAVFPVSYTLITGTSPFWRSPAGSIRSR